MEVGKAVARFVDYLTTIGLNLNELICVGHSLGAHTCGITGKHLRTGRMAAIVALDPARPLFHLKERNCRLDYTGIIIIEFSTLNMYKSLTQVADTLGWNIQLGMQIFIRISDAFSHFVPVIFHVSYLNVKKTTKYQLLIHIFRCSLVVIGEVCSHTRVHDLFLESLKHTSLFWATKCSSYNEIYNETCTPRADKALMGSHIGTQYRPAGLYYLQTNGESPFAKSHLWIRKYHSDI